MRTIGKIALCVIAYIIGMALSGALVSALRLPSQGIPEGTTAHGAFLASLVGSTLLVAGLAPLAMGLGGSRPRRFASLMAMTYVAVDVNTLIEAAKFTHFVKIGVGWMCLNSVLPCLLLAGALAWAFGSRQEARGFGLATPAQWIWRIPVAWLAYPVIYVVFGMCVAPFVMDVYRAGVAGLTIPPMTVILKTQLLRSALFLISSVPILALWTGSRRSLFLAFGFAEAMMTGIHGLAQAYWLPATLRVAHSIEISLDSFAYIGVLVLLFTARKGSAPIGPATKPAEIEEKVVVSN